MSEEFTFGIEEEYFLADAQNGHSPPGATLDVFHEAAAAKVKSASHELLKGQIEVQSEPGTSLDAAHDALAGMRAELSKIAAGHGLSLFAAGSHPLGREGDQRTTEKERYRQLEAEFGLIAARSMVCAMHIHVAVPDPDRRIDLMNRITPFLPLFYALSTSSPFWQGRDTRLKGFRLAAFSEWPRMGLPELFADQSQFDRFVARLVDAKVMENSSFVWWLIRPSNKFPTLELRICDSCTRLDDAVAIAALYRSLLSAVHRRPELNAGFGPIERGICAENIWQAQQGGLDATFVDADKGGTLTVARALDAAIAIAADDAAAFGDTAWVEKTRDILKRGTSADRQLAGFRTGISDLHAAEDSQKTEALRGVIAAMATETVL